jgi:acetolactate synthase regulatory subunit
MVKVRFTSLVVLTFKGVIVVVVTLGRLPATTRKMQRNARQNPTTVVRSTQMIGHRGYKSCHVQRRHNVMERFAIAVVLTVRADDAEDALNIISQVAQDKINLLNRSASTIYIDYATNAFPVPTDYHPNETYWSIPEVLWENGNVNLPW